jgi:hypothetical protein
VMIAVVRVVESAFTGSPTFDGRRCRRTVGSAEHRRGGGAESAQSRVWGGGAAATTDVPTTGVVVGVVYGT